MRQTSDFDEVIETTDADFAASGLKTRSELRVLMEQPKALLVMATGTGKTFTIMALIDVFMRANQARRVLSIGQKYAIS
jgi:Tfp pilus assembly pilus retraction ATPase PilT